MPKINFIELAESLNKLESIKKLADKLSFPQDKLPILIQALTHSSMRRHHKLAEYADYERLEFVGDSIMNAAISHILYKHYPKKNEGFLSQKRSSMVWKHSLIQFSLDLGINECILLGKSITSTFQTENSLKTSPLFHNILEDAFESVIGALFIGTNFEQVEKIISNLCTQLLDKQLDSKSNPKGILQEYTQRMKIMMPEYRLISQLGKSHEPEITIELMVEDLPLITESGNNKRKIEAILANRMIEIINNLNNQDDL